MAYAANLHLYNSLTNLQQIARKHHIRVENTQQDRCKNQLPRVLSLKHNIFASLDDHRDIPSEDTNIFYLLTLLVVLFKSVVDYFNSVLLLHIFNVNTTYVSTPKNPNAVF
jgi:hypothetical protein